MQRLLVVALCAIVSSACDTPSTAESDARPAKRRASGHGPRDVPGSADDPGDLPPGHPPMGTQPGMPGDAVHGGGDGMPGGEMPTDEAHGGGGAAEEGPALQWRQQDGWRTVQPSSSMRVAEWALPKVAGDAEDASLVVFHFPGGGDVQSNLDRWYAQFTQPDGRPSSEVARVSNRTVSGLRVTLTDVSGTFDGGMMMGDQPPTPRASFRLLAAIVETSSGPWFFKLTGPKDTVERWRASFDAFVGSLHQ